MLKEHRRFIEDSSYETLLRRWRFAKVGEDDIFQGTTGQYYSDIMFMKKDSHPDPVGVSKKVGWDP